MEVGHEHEHHHAHEHHHEHAGERMSTFMEPRSMRTITRTAENTVCTSTNMRGQRRNRTATFTEEAEPWGTSRRAHEAPFRK